MSVIDSFDFLKVRNPGFTRPLLLGGLAAVSLWLSGSTEASAQPGTSSFRVLQPAPAAQVPSALETGGIPNTGATEPYSTGLAVWFEGSIDSHAQSNPDPTSPTGLNPAGSDYETFNTTRLAAYEEDRYGLQETDAAIERLTTPGSVSPEMPCADALSQQEKPWLAWKSTSLSSTWIPGSGDDFGVSDFNIRAKISSPRIPFISVSPSYQATYLNGPDRTDIPGTLHRASVGFMGMLPLSPRMIGQVMVTPGIASDFENTSSDAFRTTGMATVIFIQSPQLQWIFGVIYLDREDISILPAVGLNWSPNERNKFEFSFPRPRYLHQISTDGDREQWWYLAAEFGGGSWAIERTNGTDDVVTLRDYRLLTGVEYKLPDDRSWYWEAGLVIGREVEYTSGIGDYRQDPSLMLRAGLTF